jgi:myo-inositol-1(or 4)-monophosphatase
MVSGRIVSLSPLSNIITSALLKASKTVIRDFGEIEHLQISRKDPGGFVSAADLKAEKALHAELKKARPTYSFLMEETGSLAGEDPEYCWIVDPIDGTTNFIHGLPHFALTAALEKKGEIIAGAVYDPIRDEMFWAEKGKGAYLNDRRLRVSGRRVFKDSLVATCMHLGRINETESEEKSAFLEKSKQIEKNAAAVRRMGAAALDLAYVAAGRYDGFWQPSLEIWDMAAGILLIQEAGGYRCSLTGEDDMLEQKSIIAGNEHCYGELRRYLIDK